MQAGSRGTDVVSVINQNDGTCSIDVRAGATHAGTITVLYGEGQYCLNIQDTARSLKANTTESWLRAETGETRSE